MLVFKWGVPSMLLYLEDTYSIDFTIVHFDKALSLLLLWMYRKGRDWCTDDAVTGQVRHSQVQHLGCFTQSWLGIFQGIYTIKLSISFMKDVHKQLHIRCLTPCTWVVFTHAESITPIHMYSKEAPAYRGMTMACFRIIEEEQQVVQTSDSSEIATSSTDRMAQTPILLFT